MIDRRERLDLTSGSIENRIDIYIILLGTLCDPRVVEQLLESRPLLDTSGQHSHNDVLAHSRQSGLEVQLVS